MLPHHQKATFTSNDSPIAWTSTCKQYYLPAFSQDCHIHTSPLYFSALLQCRLLGDAVRSALNYLPMIGDIVRSVYFTEAGVHATLILQQEAELTQEERCKGFVWKLSSLHAVAQLDTADLIVSEWFMHCTCLFAMPLNNVGEEPFKRTHIFK